MGILVPWHMGWYNRLCAILSNMPTYEVRQLEEDQCFVANSIAKESMAANQYGLGDSFPESDGKTNIAIFIDRLTKIVHLVFCTKEVITT